MWKELIIKDALIETNALVKWTNSYINEHKPWVDGNITVLNTSNWIIGEINKLYHPILPSKSEQISDALKSRVKEIYFERIK